MTDVERYSRQILFEEIGQEGQRRILESRVAVAGCGAIGALAVETLARAGVGYLRVIDRDFVEHTNLQRQVLFTEEDARNSIPKAVACAEHVRERNSAIVVESHVEDLNPGNAEKLFAGVDLILDGTDNFETRFLINDVAIKNGTAWIYAAAVGATAVTMTIRPNETPCLRCVLQNPPIAGSSPTCDTNGVLFPAISAISSIQCAEALKLLTGKLDALHGNLIEIDLWNNRFTHINALGQTKDPQCCCCSQRQFEFLQASSAQHAQVLCGRDAVQLSFSRREKIDLKNLAVRLQASAQGETFANEHLVRFICHPYELTVFSDGRAIVKGAQDPAQARSVYARYVGM